MAETQRAVHTPVDTEPSVHTAQFALPDLGEGLTEATVLHWHVAEGERIAVDTVVVEVETAKASVEVPCPYAGTVHVRHAAEGEELPVGAPLVTIATEGAAPAAEATDASTESSGSILVGYGTRPSPRRRRRARAAQHAVANSAVPTGVEGSSAPTNASMTADDVSDGTTVRVPREIEEVHLPTAVHGGGVTRTTPSTSAYTGVLEGTAPNSSILSVSSPSSGTSTAVGEVTVLTSVMPEGVEGVAPGSPAVATEEHRTAKVISPLVRRLARERGVDLSQVPGSGPRGLILRADVTRHAARTQESAEERGAPPVGAPERREARAPHGTRVPLTGALGTAAATFVRSHREVPDATCWVDADATELLATRRKLNAPPGGAAAHGADDAPTPVSIAALLGRICAAALARYPQLNSTVDTAAAEVVLLPEIHLGFAAQTPRGLVVPVVRNAGTRSTEELATELRRLTEAAAQGTLTPAELTGGTFTLNNYGVFGVDGSTPIVNHPQAAMLGVGRIVRKPWAHQDQLALRDVVQLSLTFDHRVCDGGTAGGFLRYVADCVEEPARLLRAV